MNEKRTELVSVRLTPTELKRMHQAAKILWPGAVVSEAGTVLGLARMMTDSVLASASPKNPR